MNKYYEILSIKPEADLQAIKKAYRKAVHRYHPDSNGGIGDTEKFKRVVMAYNHLQKHYKVRGIKPAKPKKSVFSTFKERFFSNIGNKARAGAYAKTAEPPKRKGFRKKRQKCSVDPLVLRLGFHELKDRFEESCNLFVKKEAARAMALLFGGAAIPVLKKGLKGDPSPLIEEIIFCMGIIGGRESVMVIEKYLMHPDVKIACGAVNALKMINQGNAIVILEKLEKEGRALRLWFSRFIGTFKLRKLIRKGDIIRSEVYIAAALRRNTRQPLPAILRELGWVF